MTKFKKRLIKIGIIALMPILALLLCLNNTYAYYLNSDGNIQSDNLLNNSLFIDGKAINSTTGQQIEASGYKAITEFIYFERAVYSKSLDLEVFVYDSNKNYLGNIIKESNAMDLTIFNNSYYCRFETYSNRNDLMVNLGSTLLPYEPYSIWYNEDNAFQPLNVAFNNCQVDLLNYNVSNPNVVSSTNLTINNSQLITLDNIPSLKNIIVNDEDTRYGLKFYLNNPINYILNFQMNNNVYQVNVILSNSVTGQTFAFEYGSSIENYNLVCDTNNNYYDTILYYSLLSPDYDYFSMYVNLDSASFNNGYNIGFSDGYDNGYDNGYVTGHNNGVNSSYIDGYNNGYNEGAQSNLETSGMKTLFNSILSYPVNMIKSVFDFNFMGVNIASVIMFVVSIGIVFFVIKKFKE